MIDWKVLDTPEKLEEAISASHHQDIIIFKHSTTCSVSHMAKMRLEGEWDLKDVDAYYLDLKAYRQISDHIAERFQVHHESPQILLVRKGECLYDASHFDITVAELKETLSWHAA